MIEQLLENERQMEALTREQLKCYLSCSESFRFKYSDIIKETAKQLYIHVKTIERLKEVELHDKL